MWRNTLKLIRGDTTSAVGPELKKSLLSRLKYLSVRLISPKTDQAAITEKSFMAAFKQVDKLVKLGGILNSGSVVSAVVVW